MYGGEGADRMTICKEYTHTNKEVSKKEYDAYLKLSHYIDNLKAEDRRIFLKAVLRKLGEIRRYEQRSREGIRMPAGVA
jgi:hypothetical protein